MTILENTINNVLDLNTAEEIVVNSFYQTLDLVMDNTEYRIPMFLSNKNTANNATYFYKVSKGKLISSELSVNKFGLIEKLIELSRAGHSIEFIEQYSNDYVQYLVLHELGHYQEDLEKINLQERNDIVLGKKVIELFSKIEKSKNFYDFVENLELVQLMKEASDIVLESEKYADAFSVKYMNDLGYSVSEKIFNSFLLTDGHFYFYQLGVVSKIAKKICKTYGYDFVDYDYFAMLMVDEFDKLN